MVVLNHMLFGFPLGIVAAILPVALILLVPRRQFVAITGIMLLVGVWFSVGSLLSNARCGGDGCIGLSFLGWSGVDATLICLFAALCRWLMGGDADSAPPPET